VLVGVNIARRISCQRILLAKVLVRAKKWLGGWPQQLVEKHSVHCTGAKWLALKVHEPMPWIFLAMSLMDRPSGTFVDQKNKIKSEQI
jgi:hypothetical protein